MSPDRPDGARRLRSLLLDVVLPAVVVGWLAVAVWDRRELFDGLTDVPATEVLLVAVLTAVGHLFNATEFGLLYRLVGVPIGFAENWMLFSAGQVGNYLPGQIGTVHRFRYLKVVHGLDYATATSAYSMNFAITVFATGVVGAAGVVGLAEGTARDAWWLTAGFVGLAALAVVPMVFRLPVGGGDGRLGRAWRRFAEGWDSAREAPSAALLVLVLELARYVLLAWRLQLAFSWLGVEEPFLLFLVVGPVGALATFVAVTPAGLGVREAAIAAVTATLGVGFDAGLLGSTADRAVSLAVVLLIGLPGAWVTVRRVRRVATG